jgi:uncharacterized repeat protein (TIGR01451 family)
MMAQGVYAVDVLVNMTDSPDPATRGGKITYTIVTQDQTNDIAPNVSLSFPLPATTTYVSDDSTQCNHDGGTPGIVNCAFGNLQGTATGPGDVKTVKVIVKTTSATPTVISNIVATSSTTGDTNNGNNSNTPQNTTIDDGADLTTTLLALPDPSVIAAGDVNYTAVLTNNGPNTAQNISVVFQLSINMTYVTNSVSGTGWSCSYNSGNRQLTCTGSGLNNGVSATPITFKGKVTGAQTGNLATTATVSTSTSDPEPNNDVVINNVNVAEGTDVSVTISANPLAAIENQTTIVTLKPRNLGPFDATNVVVNYTAPPGFTYQTPPTGDGWACAIDGGDAQTYHCSRGTYIVGATKNITFTLNAPAYSAGNKLNTATISTTTAEAVERLTNNSASLNMTLEHNGVDLRISKIKTPTPVAQGTNMVSTIKVTNDGPLNASSGTITITDLLDIGNITYVSGTGTNWTCDDFATTTPNVVCTYNAVLNNGNTTPALTITTTATGIGSISNTATVSYSGVPGDYDSSNNSTGAVGVTSTNSGTNSADLVVTKVVNADNSDGDTTTLAIDENSMTYTINIQNNGPSNVTGITMTDAIPNYVNNSSGETGIAFNAPGYSCNSSGKNVTCTQSGTLSNTDTDTIEIIVTRPLLDGTNVRNTASAFSSAQGDLNRTNNSNFIDVNIAPVADLLIQSKVVTPTDVKSGTEATYLITIKNNGPSTAQNVAVTDIFDLPIGDAGFTFISAIAPIGGSCSGLTGGQSYIKTDTPTLTCNWASIGSGSTRTISMKIRPNFQTGSPDGRIFKNTVSGTTTTHESDLTNNSKGPILLTVNKDLIDLVINNNDQSAGLGPDPLGHDPANGGDNANNDVIFDLDYVNRGPSFATGVNIKYFITPKDGKTVKFMCDEATSADACNTSADKCTVSNGSNPITGNAAGTATLTLSCSMPDMVADSSLHFHRYLTFRVISIPDGLGDTHDTNALISANENETILLNNAEPDDVTVRAKVDLQLTKVPSKANVKVTEPFDWIITVTNNGPASSFQADLSDSLPANMDFYGATPTWVNATDTTNGNCSVSGKGLACDFGTNGAITNGASVVVTVPVMVTHFINPTEQNCASATTNNSGVDPNPNNNTNICGTVAVTNLFFPSDFGDAPDTGIGTATVNYQTQLTDSGPRHLLDLVNPGQIYLGGCVDSDNGTLQNTNADQDDITANAGETIGSCTSGDDEDGVVVPTLISNQTATLQIEIGGNTCQLDGWIDYNADGDFTDTDEQIFSNKTLNPGAHSENIVVPANLAFGNSYARFRCSDVGGLAPTGYITGGEVEDYLVSLQPDSSITATAVDYGDAPDTGIGTLTGNYQTLPNDNGASHILGIANAPYLGSCVDSDANTAQNFSATADDFGPAAGVTPTVTTGTCSGADDEDGVILNSELKQAIPASISVTASAGTNSCILNAWIDYNQDGVFNNSNEKIANNQTIASGATATLTPTIPANSLAGITYARFRCASSGGLNSTGAAVDGEVEDYQVSITPNLTLASTKVDFGDAPDVNAGEAKNDYSTTESDNGPSHVIGLPNSPYLGLCVDSDDGTAQNMTADGDNVVGSTTVGTCDVDGQDEDGVSLVGGLTLGGQTNIKIVTAADGACVLNGWIDFNQDGQFSGSEEQVITNKSQSAGTTKTYQVNVPASAKVGQTYSRFRCSTASGLGPVGPAPDGEVEDYAVIVHSATGIPTVSEWGLMILMLLISWFAYTQRFSVRPSS